MIELPWWAANGARPVLVQNPGSIWQFDGKSTTVTIEHISSFAWSLTDEQIVIVLKLAENDNLVEGRYTTWAYFCLVHGIWQ